MNLEIDPEVKTVAEFMQRNLPQDQIVRVAENLAALAPILWGSRAVSLREQPITSSPQ